MKKHTQFLTYSGKLIDFTNLNEKDICLLDIAHHLASYKNVRFGGSLGLNIYYSVACHSADLTEYILNRNLPRALARCALMHDATEAYLGDITTGLKQMLPDYQQLEHKFEILIFEKYGIKRSLLIKQLDKRIILDELLKFRPGAYEFFQSRNPEPPLGITITQRSPQEAFDRFMKLAGFLDIKD